MNRKVLCATVMALSIGALSGCGTSHGAAQTPAAQAHGPIKIWYSNNAHEITWGKQAVADWNSTHPTELVSAQEIPAAKSSEEVIGASITAGTEPCLIFNTAPASVPQFQKAGGLVPLNDFADGQSYVESRTGSRVSQYKSPDGKYYQLPWKSNPVVIFYNKTMFAKAGIDPNNPPLRTYDEFLATAKRIVSSGAAKYALYASPTSQFYQSWFDFYPTFAAESGGKQLVVDGEAQFNSPAGQAVAKFWQALYADNLADKEQDNGDALVDGTAAMTTGGPWGIASYQGKVDWGVAQMPTSMGMDASASHTFTDAKSVGMYSSCQNRGTAWDFLKFTTGAEQDGKLLAGTGQMPMRANLAQLYPSYFAEHPEYTTFAALADRAVEVPDVPNSISIWQNFRDAWSKSVIFGKADPVQALAQSADRVNQLAGQR